MRWTLLLLLAAVPCFSQWQCAGQLKPLRPTGLFCSGGSEQVSCVCNSGGTSCRWLWGCGAPARGGLDASIPLQGDATQNPTRLQTPLEIQRQVEELRALQLQNAISAAQLAGYPPPEKPLKLKDYHWEERVQKARLKIEREEAAREKKLLKQQEREAKKKAKQARAGAQESK